MSDDELALEIEKGILKDRRILLCGCIVRIGLLSSLPRSMPIAVEEASANWVDVTSYDSSCVRHGHLALNHRYELQNRNRMLREDTDMFVQCWRTLEGERISWLQWQGKISDLFAEVSYLPGEDDG